MGNLKRKKNWFDLCKTLKIRLVKVLVFLVVFLYVSQTWTIHESDKKKIVRSKYGAADRRYIDPGPRKEVINNLVLREIGI